MNGQKNKKPPLSAGAAFKRNPGYGGAGFRVVGKITTVTTLQLNFLY